MNHNDRNPFLIGVVVLLGLVTTLSQTGRAQSVYEHLVLWNKLGSDQEVLNSAYGPDLEFYTGGGGIHVPGNRTYVPGVFGGAVTLDEGPYYMCARVHNIVLNNLYEYIDPEQGTIELWYQQVSDPVPYSHDCYRIFDGCFGLGSGMSFCSAYNFTVGAGRMVLGNLFGGSVVQVYSLEDGVAGYNISPYNGTWIHLGRVWDRQGIDASADTMRLYLDGEVVAATTDDGWGTTVGDTVDICGGNDAGIAFKFYMDNLKVWDYAKTDFSDRFVEGVVVPALDIKPGSCPNSFNRDSHGVLPVALLGTECFDVTQVDLATIQLSRADGVGGWVVPHEGPPGPHTVYEDVGTPFAGEPCDCHEAGADGFVDLSMNFKTDEVVPNLLLDELDAGALVELVVTGELLDGTGFIASDCVRLVPPGTAPGLLTVQSSVPGAWIGVDPLDETLDGGGFADFERSFPLTTVVTLAAEEWAEGRPLRGWQIGGLLHHMGDTSVEFTIDQDMTARAVYGPTPSGSPKPPGEMTPDEMAPDEMAPEPIQGQSAEAGAIDRR